MRFCPKIVFFHNFPQKVKKKVYKEVDLLFVMYYYYRRLWVIVPEQFEGVPKMGHIKIEEHHDCEEI